MIDFNWIKLFKPFEVLIDVNFSEVCFKVVPMGCI